MNTFPVSGYPNYLEYYRCYEDPGRKEWVDGMEYHRNQLAWNDEDGRTKAKWRFFYRPLRPLVGRPQKAEIWSIHTQIASEEEALAKERREWIQRLVVMALALVIAFWIWEWLALVPLVFGAVFSLQFLSAKQAAEKRIADHRARIEALYDEIRQLQAQIEEPPDAQTVSGWLREEIQALERDCLVEAINKSGDHDTFEDIKHEPFEGAANPYGVRGLLIDGWGPLQPMTVSTPFGTEPTGLKRVVQELGGAHLTWRPGSEAQPIFRVLYLQFIFLLEKNITIESLFYDFVTKQRYGRRSETFQYNHVSNYAIREIELEEDGALRAAAMDHDLRRSMVGKTFNAFQMAVSSGGALRCILSDDSVIDGLNEWIGKELELRKQQVETREAFLETMLGDRSRDTTDPRLGEHLESLNRDRADLRALIEKTAQLKKRENHAARRVLHQIRENIQNYVLRVTPADGMASAPAAPDWEPGGAVS